MKTTFKITFDRPRTVSGGKVITPTTTVWFQSKEQAQEVLIRLINKQEETFDIIKNVRMKTFMGIKITDNNIIIPNDKMSDEDIVSFAKFRKQHWTKLNLSRGEWFMCNTRAFAKIVLDLGLHNCNKNPIINVDKTIERFTKEVKVTVNKKTVKKRIWFTDFLKGNRKKLPQSIFKFNKLLPLIEWAEEIEESA
tara:strand:+ start:76 stop:657 length:582 start_codon:yes stop_codon:yes gene_type:complete